MTSKPDEPEVLGTFDKCPNCGSEERLVQSLVDEAVKEKRISEDTVACLQPMSSMVIGPKDLVMLLAPKIVDVAMAITDACKGCGTIYTVKQIKGKQMATPGPAMPGMQQGFPGKAGM